MPDEQQGVQTPDDASLFSDATTTTLEKFENAALPLPPEPSQPPPPPEVKPPSTATTELPKPEAPDAPVPAGRLREEAEARRRAERERDELLRQLAAQRVAPPAPPQPPIKPPDLFENPSGFVQHEVRPFFEQIQQAMRMQTETNSEQLAAVAHGFEKVAAAKQALTEGMHRGDPNVRAVWEQAMQSAHPYDLITRWHRNQETMREIGGDAAAYKQRVRDEAMKDPEFQRQVVETMRGGTPHVARPASSSSAPSVPKIPSLGNVGAGSDTSDLQEPSDNQLFHAVTSARRR